MEVNYNLAVAFSAICGFLIASYIFYKKSAHGTLVCPIGSNCDAVIHSPFSKFIGIRVEIIGLLYYGVVFMVYAYFVSAPDFTDYRLSSAVLVASVMAFIFSIYLTLVQLFSLKQLCTWCLVSAGLSTLIFLFSLMR